VSRAVSTLIGMCNKASPPVKSDDAFVVFAMPIASEFIELVQTGGGMLSMSGIAWLTIRARLLHANKIRSSARLRIAQCTSGGMQCPCGVTGNHWHAVQDGCDQDLNIAPGSKRYWTERSALYSRSKSSAEANPSILSQDFPGAALSSVTGEWFILLPRYTSKARWAVRLASFVPV
jgi:hypothetical protein